MNQENLDKEVFVTQPSLPPLKEFLPYLEQIWKTKILTNNGPYHRKLEDALCEHLEVPYISLFTNATIALITAIKALDISGDVITTPYSFVATTHSLVWNNIRPVFIDIDPRTCNLNANLIENAITENTTAIIPVHCYGNPCDVDTIKTNAEKHNLSVIYDAAHAFGVEHLGKSLLSHGDLSVLSFHATKVFNTFEGGAIISHTSEMKKKVDNLKNFGFETETTVSTVGINGKMSEFNAAYGLLQLKYIDDAIAKRREIESIYRENLKPLIGIDLLDQPDDTSSNGSYMPILINKHYQISRDKLYGSLKKAGVNCRRYFYPLLTNLSMYSTLPTASKENLPFANDISQRILCLPIFESLSEFKVLQIIDLITSYDRRN